MPDEYVNVSVVVAADGSVVDTTYPREHVADIRVQPFGSGGYDIAFITTVEASESRSVTKAAADNGDAAVTAMYCNFSADFSAPEYAHQVTVRVQTSRDRKPADRGFRLDLQLA